MAILSEIRLKDSYTSQANKVVSSMSKIDSKLKGLEKTSKVTDSALKKTFGRTYDLKIKDVKSKKVRKDLQSLQSDLRKFSGKNYQVKITTRMNKQGFSAIKSGIQNLYTGGASKLKGGISGFKEKAMKVKVDVSAFLKARREAKRLSKELYRTTGKKHKVKVSLKSDGMGLLDRIKSKLSGIKNFKLGNLFGGKSGGKSSGGGGLGMLGAVVGGNLISGAISTGVGAIKSGASAIFGSGLKRLNDIQGSKATLKGLGYDKATTDVISSNALTSVKGTSFGMGDAMQTAAGAVAAGVKPGEALESMLKVVSNSAAAAKVGMGEMGSIFNKVVTSGIAQNEELNQVADRGIPIYTALADVMGVSASEVKKLASEGKVDFDTFQEGMKKASGTVAFERGKTASGSFENLKSSFGRIGANLLGGKDGESGIFGKLAPAIQSVTEKLGVFEEAAGGIGEKLGTAFTDIGSRLGPIFESVFNTLRPVGEALFGVINPLIPHFQTLAGIIGPIVSTAFTALGQIITGSVVPVIQTFGSFLSTASNVVMSVAVPVLNTAASIIKGVVIPAFSALVSGGINIVKGAFSLLKGVIDSVRNAFNSVKNAVSNAVSSLSGIGGMIKEKISGMLGAIGIGNNAGGTQHFRGGLTTMNEMGGEALQLPKGTKIYPASTTKKMINEKIGGGGNQQSVTKNITLSPIININGANKTNNEVGKDVMRELKRLAVTV